MTDTLPAPLAGDTKRAYAARHGLAKPGRGRFGAPALAAIAAAEAAGFVFSDPVVVKAAPKPKAEKPSVTESAPVREARARAAAPVTTVKRPSPLDMPKVRPVRSEKEGYVVERNTLIAFGNCAKKGGCGKPVNQCSCATGPKAPHWLDKDVAGTPLLLTKPVV